MPTTLSSRGEPVEVPYNETLPDEEEASDSDSWISIDLGSLEALEKGFLTCWTS